MFRKCTARLENALGALVFGATLLETNKALATPAIATRLAELRAVITPGTPDQFAAHIKAQTDLWSGIINAAKIQPD